MSQRGHIVAHRQFVCPRGLRSARASRSPRCRQLVISNVSATETARRTTKKEALKDARDDVRELIKSKHCNPILVRVAWHDSGTYDEVCFSWRHACAVQTAQPVKVVSVYSECFFSCFASI